MDFVISKAAPTYGKAKTINGRNKLIKTTSLDTKKEQNDTNFSIPQKSSLRKKPILKGRSESANALDVRRKAQILRRNSETLSPPKKLETKVEEENVTSSPKLLTPNQLTIRNASIGSRKPPFSFSPDCQLDTRDNVERFSEGSPQKRQVSFEGDFNLRSPSTRDALLRLSPSRSQLIQFEINERPDHSLKESNSSTTYADDVLRRHQFRNSLKPAIQFLDMETESSLESKDNEQSEEMTDSSCPTVVEVLDSAEQASSSDRKNHTNDSAMFEKTDSLMKEVTKLIENFQNFRPQEQGMFSQENAKKTEGIPVTEDTTSAVEYVHPHATEQFPTTLTNVTELPQTLEPNNNSKESEFTSEELIPSTFTSDEIHRKIAQTLTKIEQEEMKDFMRHSSSYDDLQRLDEPYQSVNHSFCPLFSHAASIPTSRSCSRLSCISSCPSHPHNINCISPRICSSRVSSKPEISSLQAGERNKNEMYNSPYNSQHFTNSDLSLNTKEQFGPSATINQMSTVTHMHDYPAAEPSYVPSDDKAKKLFEFLEEVDRSDREALFALKYNPSSTQYGDVNGDDEFTNRSSFKSHKTVGKKEPEKATSLQTMESLIRKGPVQLAKELIILDRKYEEATQSIRVLEETLLHQRELSIRNIKNSEKDMKKRLRLQKEEFEMAFSRNEALVNEMVIEKRTLQEKLDKLITNFNEAESKYKEYVKALQQKHLDEIKRLRKAQLQAENSRKQQWVGNKTQEIKELTVKGLEPEVQRIIQRHQQEMNELRAWHADEIREIEDRYQRKLNMHQQENREKFAQELDLASAKEKEAAKKRLQAEMKLKDDDFEVQKRRLANEVEELRNRLANNEVRLKDLMDENVRKAQIKAEIEQEHLREEFETKLLGVSRKHENEIQTLKEIYEAEKDNIAISCAKKYEEVMKEKEREFFEMKRLELEKELREKERQLREDFERTRREDEELYESRMRRTQEKLQSEIEEMDQRERELKTRLNNAKTEILRLEEDTFAFKTSIGQKDKQIHELQDANLKMSEERVNLTSVIRREFSVQIESVEEEVRNLKAKLVELQATHLLELEQKQAEVDKVLHDKSLEIEKIGFRVQQTISGREETIHELQKQLETSNFHTQHLESLLEQQRKDMIDSMTRSSSSTTKRK